jgi:Trypsin
MVDWPAGTQFWVSFDPVYDEDAAAPTGLVPVSSFAYHEAFGQPGGGVDAHDIAMVTLATPQTTAPAQLPTRGLLNTYSQQHLRQLGFTTVGYGIVRTDKTGGPHGFIDETTRMVAQQTLLSLQPTWLLLNMNPATGSGGTCYGDSGGPHFLGGMTSNLIVSLTVTGDTVCRATGQELPARHSGRAGVPLARRARAHALSSGPERGGAAAPLGVHASWGAATVRGQWGDGDSSQAARRRSSV